MVILAQWGHFTHEADIGIKGIGATPAEAFAQAALAMTAVITDPETVRSSDCIKVRCESPDLDYLLVDWLNALVYEMATRRMLFGRFDVRIENASLTASVCGERIDRQRHQPAVEIKGATLTELCVKQLEDGQWLARCVVDV